MSFVFNPFTGKFDAVNSGGGVDSVNGQVGVVVLDTDDIADTAVNRYTNDTDITRLASTSGTNTGDQDLSALALKSNVLELDNTDAFTPDADYEPATKKYVDDNGGGVFTVVSNVVKASGAVYATDDFVFGSPSLDYDSDTNHQSRFFFDKGTGAFRAGSSQTDAWDNVNLGTDSVAFGTSSKATVIGAFAAGSGSISSGSYSFTAGLGSEATAIGSCSIGRTNDSTGSYSTTIGQSNIASGLYGVALGRSNTSSNTAGVALGRQNVSSGLYSVSIGYITEASGTASTSIGANFLNNQNYSLSFGYGTGITDTTGVAIRLEADADQDDTKKKAIFINQTTAPTSTTDRLYNVGGYLTWNGTDTVTSLSSTGATTTPNGTLAVDIAGTTYYLLTAAAA